MDAYTENLCKTYRTIAKIYHETLNEMEVREIESSIKDTTFSEDDAFLKEVARAVKNLLEIYEEVLEKQGVTPVDDDGNPSTGGLNFACFIDGESFDKTDIDAKP